MKAKKAASVRSKTKASKPLRWDEIPHRDLWLEAHRAIDLDSPARAATDALQSVLKKRLFRMNHDEHRTYVQIECARIVEALRVVRDTYRGYLRTKIDGPLVEMYWVVARFEVKDWAVMRLRDAAIDYAVASQIPKPDWNELYGFEGLMLLSADKDRAKTASTLPYLESAAAQTAITGKLRTLRREMMHSVHNAAKNTALRLARVWGKREPPATKGGGVTS